LRNSPVTSSNRAEGRRRCRGNWNPWSVLMLVSAEGGLRSSRKRRSNTLNTDYHPELFASCGLAEPFDPLFFPPARRKLLELSRWDLKADLDRSVPANCAVKELCNRVPGRASGCTLHRRSLEGFPYHNSKAIGNRSRATEEKAGGARLESKRSVKGRSKTRESRSAYRICRSRT